MNNFHHHGGEAQNMLDHDLEEDKMDMDEMEED